MTTIRELLTEHNIDLDQELADYDLAWTASPAGSRVSHGGMVIHQPGPRVLDIHLIVPEKRP